MYGGEPDRDYTEDLRKVMQNLPPIAASILNNSGTEIVVLDNMFSVDENGDVTPRIGRYYANKIRYILIVGTLIKEHYFQKRFTRYKTTWV